MSVRIAGASGAQVAKNVPNVTIGGRGYNGADFEFKKDIPAYGYTPAGP